MGIELDLLLSSGNDFREEIGQRLRRFRQARRLIPANLARASGVGGNNIASIERAARSISSREIVKLCLVLDITPNDLLGWDRIAELHRKLPG